MKERLVQLLDLEQLTPSKFADIIGVQRSSVSHVVSGRNNPSYDFLQKTLKAFPGLNAEWLILGKGTMYEQMGRGVTGTLFDSAEEQMKSEIPDEGFTGDQKSDLEAGPSEKSDQQKLPEQYASSDTGGDNDLDASQSTPISESHPTGEMAQSESKRIVQVMVIYSDDTFRSYTPSQ